jgi:8-oxo-dGTP pyrophosphatase MutT (NUDIX family)
MARSETHPIPVVCIIVERLNKKGERKILIQQRPKLKKSVAYPGVWELPQGKVRAGESIEAAACRELEEETKLSVVSIGSEHEIKGIKILQSSLLTFLPTITVLDREHNYIGFGIVVTCKQGSPRKTAEASFHKWIDRTEAVRLIRNDRLFPLNVPVIQKYFGI